MNRTVSTRRTTPPSFTAVQFTCMGVFRSERPLVQQSGIAVSVCQRGWQQIRFRKTLCLLPGTESYENHSRGPKFIFQQNYLTM